jgi:hypothetical protein
MGERDDRVSCARDFVPLLTENGARPFDDLFSANLFACDEDVLSSASIPVCVALFLLGTAIALFALIAAGSRCARVKLTIKMIVGGAKKVNRAIASTAKRSRDGKENLLAIVIEEEDDFLQSHARESLDL